MELSRADSTGKRQRRLCGAFQLGMKGGVSVLQVDEGGRGTQAEGTRMCKGQRAGERVVYLWDNIEFSRNLKCAEGGKGEEAGRVVWDQIMGNLEWMHEA